MENDKVKEPIIVIGTGRSGTSTIAGILYYLGVKMGREFIHANERNPIGYYEDLRLTQLANGLGFDTDISNMIFAIKENYKTDQWGLKVPKLVDYLENVLAGFPKAKYIICRRNKEDTLKSLCKTMVKSQAEKVYNRRTHKINKMILSKKYDALGFNIEDFNVKMVKSIADYIGVKDTRRIKIAEKYYEFTEYIAKHG